MLAVHFAQPPEWRWYILGYFFLAGLAGGTYVIGTMLRLLGRPVDEAAARLCFLLAFPLIDIALLYELAENPSKALLGDAQYVEQLSNRQPGIAADEMDNAMVRPSEAELLEDGIRVGNEIAIGEEQELDQLDDFLFLGILSGNYVSHIDIFLELGYVASISKEMSLPLPIGQRQ